MTKRPKPKSKTTRGSRLKTQLNSENGSARLTSQKEDSNEYERALADTAGFIVAMLKGAAPQIDEEEAFDFVVQLIHDGCDYREAVTLGEQLARGTYAPRGSIQ